MPKVWNNSVAVESPMVDNSNALQRFDLRETLQGKLDKFVLEVSNKNICNAYTPEEVETWRMILNNHCSNVKVIDTDMEEDTEKGFCMKSVPGQRRQLPMNRKNWDQMFLDGVPFLVEVEK